jgi:pantetheine-phosphate adenylyltransferase
MKRTAVFPGSFDPVTKGHESVIRRAIPLFDEIIVAIGKNSTKASMFTLEQRMEWISKCFKDENKIRVVAYDGLTVDFCKKENAAFILRGLRSGIDFEYEKSIAQMNKGLNPGIETVFLMTDPEYAAVQSTIIREIIKNGGDYRAFVPASVTI